MLVGCGVGALVNNAWANRLLARCSAQTRRASGSAVKACSNRSQRCTQACSLDGKCLVASYALGMFSALVPLHHAGLTLGRRCSTVTMMMGGILPSALTFSILPYFLVYVIAIGTRYVGSDPWPLFALRWLPWALPHPWLGWLAGSATLPA